MVRRCWVNFQCRGVLLTWITVGHGPIVLAVGAGGGCMNIFSLIYHLSFLSPSLWEAARYRLKYCLKGPLSPKQPSNQPTVRPNVNAPGKIHDIGRPYLIICSPTGYIETHTCTLFFLESTRGINLIKICIACFPSQKYRFPS